MALSRKMSALLECKICLDQFERPKLLSCGHTYCKNCLDKILIFKEDGSAEIQCPLKCKSNVTIGRGETTICLPTNYSLSDIVDETEADREPSSCHQSKFCQQSTQCKKKVTFSCTKCGMKICDQCQIVHLCKAGSFTAITFDKKSEEIKPLCRQHNSLANNVCIECENTFTCVYCTNRQHKNHKRKTIVDFGVEAKKWFQSFIQTFEDTKRVLLENLNQKYGEALTGFQSSRGELVRELEVRKMKRVEQYLKRLNNEQENILRQFDEDFKAFKTNVIANGYTDERKIKDHLEYVKAFNDKSSFELVPEKVEIERNLRELSTVPATVPCFSSHLHDLNEQDLIVNPLGKIEISIDNMKPVKDAGYINVYDCRITETKTHCNQLELQQNLMDLVEGLKGNTNPVGATGGLEKEKSNVKLGRKVKEVYTYEEVVKIIKNNDVKKLQSTLIDDPTIVEMRGDDDATLLMEAAHYNKPSIVQCLIDAGSDVNAVNKYECNTYHYSADYGHHDALKILINHDVTNINNGDEYNYTPLHIASENRHIECVKLLLSIPHIDVNIRNIDNETAYDVARNGTIRRLLQEHRKTN